MRSKISATIVILGPLLMMLIVGFSFSKPSEYYLNIGIYSDEYTEFTDEFINTLSNGSFSLKKYDNQSTCVEDIEVGIMHTCIVFPPDFQVSDDNVNRVTFYVDQSKINLVYMILNTLTGSFSNKSSEISVNLTSEIVNALFESKQTVLDAKSTSSKVVSENDAIKEQVDQSKTKIDSLDFSINSELGSFGSNIGGLRTDIDGVRTNMLNHISDSKDDLYYLRGDVNANLTDDVDDIIDIMQDMNETISDFHNESIFDIEGLILKFDSSIDDMSKKLVSAGSVTDEVRSKLDEIASKSDALKSDMAALDSHLDKITARIDNIKVVSPESIAAPITTDIQPVVKESSNLGFMYPSLILILIMFIGLLLPSLLIIMEKKSRAYFRIFTTPTRDGPFVISTYVTSLIILFFQLLIILLVSQFYFKIGLLENIAMISLVLFLSTSLFILLGMFTGYLFNTEEMATISSVCIGSLFLLTSGLIIPLESLPAYVASKARYNPFIIGSDLFKKTLLFDLGYPALQDSINLLALYSLIGFILVILIQKLSKFRFLHTRPKRKQILHQQLKSQFKYKDRPAANIEELYYAIDKMDDSEFVNDIKKKDIIRWLTHICRNKRLVKMIRKEKDLTRNAVLNLLKEEISQKKTKAKKKSS